MKKNLIFLFLICSLQLTANKKFEWTPALKNAYQKIISLRFGEAKPMLAQIKRIDPNNLMVHHVENYMDFFRVYINEEEAEFVRLEANKDARLVAIKLGDKSSPYYLYLQANIRLHWALARLKFEEYSTAALEVNKAFKLLERNMEKFPAFMPNKKDLGILHAIVGTIPDNYRWIVELLSAMEGTFEQGKKELEEVISYAQNHDFVYEEEIYVLYAYLLLHLGNDSNGAWEIINTGKLRPTESPMSAFIMANVAMRTDRGDKAISILENRPQSRIFHSFPYLDYMHGLTKLQRLDKDANIYLKRFTNNFKGKNFIKDAYQKLSWHALINENLSNYHYYKNLSKTKGNTTVGSDKSADNAAKLTEIPNIKLLKSRLLFDGGRFQSAYDMLNTQCESDFQTQKEKLEYLYRKGRIAHKMEKYPEAIAVYQETIKEGRKDPRYYACRAALEMGLIYEKQQEFRLAKSAFENCLSIKPNEHKTALHHKAKAGLNRIGS